MLECSPSDQACIACTNYIIPASTIIFTNIVFAISGLAVFKADKAKSLGSLNPIVFAWQTVLGLAYIIFAFYLRDLTIFLSNVFGLISGIFYTFRTLPLASRRQQNEMLLVYLFGCLVIFTGGALSFVVFETPDPMAYASLIIMVCFYASPIMGIYSVIKSRNSSSIYMPLTIASLFTCVAWFFYGLILINPIFWVPNIFTISFQVIAIALWIILPHNANVLPPPFDESAEKKT